MTKPTPASVQTPLKPLDSMDDITEMLAPARHASVFMKALSHETRLLILCLLVTGEKSVGELEHALKIPQSAVSQQLARLRSDHLVTTRRDGRTIYYTIADDEICHHLRMLNTLFCRRIDAVRPSPQGTGES